MFGAKIRKSGIKLYCLGGARWCGALSLIKLCYLILKHRPDVVVTWLYHADLVGSLAAKLCGVRRLVWNIRCSDMDFSKYASSTRLIVKILSALSCLPSTILYNSDSGKEAHQSLGYSARRWRYIPNGFDLNEWYPSAEDRRKVRDELGIRNNEKVVGMVARVDPQKDHETFLSAMEIVVEKYPNVRLVLIGKGTERLALSSVLQDNAVVLGQRMDVNRLVRGFDVAVLSSAYGEGFPNVLGECMASAVPCVTTDVGDARAIVGETGRVVPISQPEKMSSAIIELLSLDPSEREKLRVSARAKIGDSYSIDAVALLYLREIFLS